MILKELLIWFIYLMIIIGFTYLIIKYVGQRTKVVGSSMESHLKNGEHLLIEKLSYRFRSPRRFEVIVFLVKATKNSHYIKRIIALPGESIQIRDGYVYTNGKKLNENYGLEPIKNAGIATKKINLNNNEYFVLGDNRNHSLDSRDISIGVIHRHEIIGRIWIRIWPHNNKRVVVK